MPTTRSALSKSATPCLLHDEDLNMEFATLSARLATFKPPTKRSKAGWPHATPTPEDLAKAGFYYKPSAASNDNVICYMCERSLDGWEPNDDPTEEHLKHSPDCGWALLMSIGLHKELDPATIEDPTSERHTEARRATFAAGWPHDSKRAWVCKSEKMVEAGWYFAPTEDSEDFVSCAYCKLSLDGWEPKDNPFDEHHRRSPECLFFVFAGTTAPSKRPKAKKGRTSRGSRTSKASSRLSTQSNVTMQSDAPSIPDLDESIDTSTMSNMSTMSAASTATNKGKRKAGGRKTSTKPKKTRSTRSKKVKESEPEDIMDMEGEQSTLQPMDIMKGMSNVDVYSPRGPTQTLSNAIPPSPKQQSPQRIDEPVPVMVPSPLQGKTVSARPSLDVPVTRSSPAPVVQPETTKDQVVSPTNSDIENAPPSTLPDSDRPPISSPVAEQPLWTAVDIGSIFHSTPTADLWPVDGYLTDPEKKMTVQEWIKHIAGQAEADLKAEGERLVGKFEKEGARAMAVLESMVCI